MSRHGAVSWFWLQPLRPRALPSQTQHRRLSFRTQQLRPRLPPPSLTVLQRQVRLRLVKYGQLSLSILPINYENMEGSGFYCFYTCKVFLLKLYSSRKKFSNNSQSAGSKYRSIRELKRQSQFSSFCLISAVYTPWNFQSCLFIFGEVCLKSAGPNFMEVGRNLDPGRRNSFSFWHRSFCLIVE